MQSWGKPRKRSLGVCFAFCIRKGKIHNFNFVLSIPTSKHPLAPAALYQDWRRWNSDVDNSYFPPETCTTTIMCAWLSRSARELSHVHSRQKGPRTGNRRTRKTILVAMESTVDCARSPYGESTFKRNRPSFAVLMVFGGGGVPWGMRLIGA